MALDNIPWLVSGAEHSAASARTVAYAATGGKSGIADRLDFKVVAQEVPNGTVSVLPGVASVVSTYPGAVGQSYVARNLSATSVAIQPTGSSGSRSDLVVLSIVDPEYVGDVPSDPQTFDYSRLEVISGVDDDTTDLRDLEFGYPAIPLARIDIPANTATITDSMITSVRFLANPRSKRYLFTHGVVHDERDSLNYPTAYGDEGERWPNVWWYHDIPEWATDVRVRAFYGSVRVEQKSPNNYGKLWAQIGSFGDSFRTQQVNWDISTEGGIARHTWMVADDRSVPARFRGRKNEITYLRGNILKENNNGPRLDSASSISLDLEYYEKPL